MKYDLSVLVPGIRTDNWMKLYRSVANSFDRPWEIIFAGPYELPKELKHKDNVRFIKDWGTPIRCQQMALCQAQGWYITWAADDGVFLPSALSTGFNMLKFQGQKRNNLIMGKYLEGEGFNEPMRKDDYYVLSNHDASYSPFLPKGYFMLNVGIVDRSLLFELGGWDCQFEVCPMSYNDLAIRLQNDGANFIVQNEIMFRCSHMPGHTGDHGPVHDGQVLHDEPLFRQIYSHQGCRDRKAILLDNWENAPKIWERRFNGKPEANTQPA